MNINYYRQVFQQEPNFRPIVVFEKNGSVDFHSAITDGGICEVWISFIQLVKVLKAVSC
jgi:hypothetical protein